MIAIDVSSSMLAEDFAPANRLEVAKRQAIALHPGRDADRIGLVAFAGEALTQIPVTLDYACWSRRSMALRVGTLEDGTAIGSGLATAVNRLRRVPAKSKVVLLLTDGVNNRGAIDPRTAADAAAAFGIKVYTVGVGTQGEARIPTGRGLSGFRYEMLPVEIDEVLLKEIAGKTGGRYFRATDNESLSRISSRSTSWSAPGSRPGSIAPRTNRPPRSSSPGSAAWRSRSLLGSTVWCGRHELRLDPASRRWRRCVALLAGLLA